MTCNTVCAFSYLYSSFAVRSSVLQQSQQAERHNKKTSEEGRSSEKLLLFTAHSNGENGGDCCHLPHRQDQCCALTHQWELPAASLFPLTWWKCHLLWTHSHSVWTDCTVVPSTFQYTSVLLCMNTIYLGTSYKCVVLIWVPSHVLLLFDILYKGSIIWSVGQSRQALSAKNDSRGCFWKGTAS